MSLARLIESLPEDRFGEKVPVDPSWPGLDRVDPIIKHRVIRRYSTQPLDARLIRLICACALSIRWGTAEDDGWSEEKARQ